MSEDTFSKRMKRHLRRLGFAAIAFACLSGFSCWYVHRPFDVQRENYERFGMLVLPIESLGEATTILTDTIGITGIDAEIDNRGFTDDDNDVFLGGTPQGEVPVNYLKNTGYSVGYCESRKVPLWACYRVFEVEDLSSPPRPNGFNIDMRSTARVPHDAYTRSGYDRGHMAPNYAIASRFGREGQLETFLMTNVAPQRPSLNRGPWRELEWEIARYYAQTCDSVWVITGPIFEGEPSYLESGVEIPKGYYKIAVDLTSDTIRVMSFIFLQENLRHEWLRRHLVSVDQVENLTGLDFFSDLPDDIEDELESRNPTRLWRPSLTHHILRMMD